MTLSLLLRGGQRRINNVCPDKVHMRQIGDACEHDEWGWLRRAPERTVQRLADRLRLQPPVCLGAPDPESTFGGAKG